MRTRCPGWLYGAAAAMLAVSACSNEVTPRKNRPADRSGTQYARVDAEKVEARGLAAVAGSHSPDPGHFCPKGETKR